MSGPKILDVILSVKMGRVFLLDYEGLQYAMMAGVLTTLKTEQKANG